MRSSYSLRLGAAFAVVGLAAAVLTAVLVNVAFGSRFASYLDARQNERLDAIVAALGTSYERNGGWEPRDLQQIGSVALMDGGTVTMATPTGEQIWTVEAGPMAEVHREMMGTGPLGAPTTAPIEVAGETVGIATLQLPEPGLLPADLSFRRSVNQLLAVAGGAAGLAALLAGIAVARRSTAPARALTDASRAMAAGDRSRRVPEDRADEFGQMAVAFNRMADTIDAEDQLRRAFATDVAHELRTPLMILRGEVEAMQDGIVAPTPAALASLQEETVRLGRLVDDLQTLAHADAAAFTLDRRPVDIAALARQTADDLGTAFAEAGVALNVAADTATWALADPGRLRQVIANLLTNAVKFTPPGGHAELDVTRDGVWATIRVTNSGPPVPSDELPHLFERFFRGSRARPEGSGIGLTVVRQLAIAHGGDAEATSDETGTTIVVRTPAG